MVEILQSRFLRIVTAIACLFFACAAPIVLGACSIGGEKDALVISREDGSGTRDAFDGLVEKDGVSLKSRTLVPSAEILSKTGDVMTKVSSVRSAIGYISLGSMNGTVKPLKIDGVEATAENINSAEYKFWRPFVIMTNKALTEEGRLTPAANDFLLYLRSRSAQEIAGIDYVSVPFTAEYKVPETPLGGIVAVRGSTSVEPLMSKLIADYRQIGGVKVRDVDFDMQCQGSSQGASSVKADVNGNVIGMSSSAVKAADQSAITFFNVALDAIVVIVNKNNELSSVSLGQLFDIYTGNVKKFSALMPIDGVDMSGKVCLSNSYAHTI